MSLTKAAQTVLNKMGTGMRLFVRRTAPYEAKLLNPHMPEPAIPMDLGILPELINSGVISELPEFRTNDKIGWSEGCLDGHTYHIYACTQ